MVRHPEENKNCEKGSVLDLELANLTDAEIFTIFLDVKNGEKFGSMDEFVENETAECAELFTQLPDFDEDFYYYNLR